MSRQNSTTEPSITPSFHYTFAQGSLASHTYKVSMSVCPNPFCMCDKVQLDFFPENQDEAYSFELDLEQKTLLPAAERLNFDPVIAESYLAEMDEEDWNDYMDKYHLHKTVFTESESIADQLNQEMDFPFLEIEKEFLLQDFQGYFPYAMPFFVTFEGQNYAIHDLYCLRKDCRCTELSLAAYPENEEGTAFLVQYNWKTKQWKIDESVSSLLNRSQAETVFRQFLQEFHENSLYQNTLFPTYVAKRHARFRTLYQYSFKQFTLKNKAKTALAPPTIVKIGRNDPCICGSGKKYKNCCGKGK
jgi:SEC-C motif